MNLTRSMGLMASLAGGASLFALAYMHPAMAQTSDQPAASSSNGLEEVIVTARRKEEKAQSVPIALTTFSKETLDQLNIRTTGDIAFEIPSFLPCCGKGGVLTFNLSWARGVAGTVEYWAGAAQTAVVGQSLFFDVDSVQFLNGPQGTLFGIASDGGALVIEPKKPTNEFEGTVELQLGDYGHIETQGVVNIPVVPDKFLVRVGGEREVTDGYKHILNLNETQGNVNYWLGRISATLRPTDGLENTTIFNYFTFHDNNNLQLLDLLNTQMGVASGTNYSNIGYGSPYAYLPYQAPGKLGFYAQAYSDAPTYEAGTAIQAVNTTTYDINDNLTVKNILDYQEYDPGASSTGTFAPFPDLGCTCYVGPGANVFTGAGIIPIKNPAAAIQGTISEEIQFLGKAFDDKLSYTAGSFNQRAYTMGPHNIVYATYLGGAFGGGPGSGNVGQHRRWQQHDQRSLCTRHLRPQRPARGTKLHRRLPLFLGPDLQQPADLRHRRVADARCGAEPAVGQWSVHRLLESPKLDTQPRLPMAPVDPVLHLQRQGLLTRQFQHRRGHPGRVGEVQS